MSDRTDERTLRAFTKAFCDDAFRTERDLIEAPAKLLEDELRGGPRGP